MDERPEACPEWRDDLASWLVAQVPPDREAALTAHLAGCATCRAEADSLLAVAAVTLAVDPGAPPHQLEPPGVGPSNDLGDRILALVTAERRGRRSLRIAAIGLAAAAAAVVAVVIVRPDDDPAPLAGNVVEFALVPRGAAASAVVAEDGDGALVELVATGFDPTVTYALWLSPPGGGWDDRIPAGTFRPDADGRVEARLRSGLAAADTGRVWATTPDGEVALDTKG